MKFTDLIFGAGIVSLIIICVAAVGGLINLVFRGLYFMMSHPAQALGLLLLVSLAAFAIAKFVSR